MCSGPGLPPWPSVGRCLLREGAQGMEDTILGDVGPAPAPVTWASLCAFVPVSSRDAAQLASSSMPLTSVNLRLVLL